MKYFIASLFAFILPFATASYFIPPHGVTLPMHQAGEVFMWGGASCPTGAFALDGSSKLTASYPALQAVLGYTYGGGGANFNLPNAQGVFVRGSGTQTISGTPYTGTRGTSQNDHLGSHSHQVYGGSAGSAYTTIGNAGDFGIGGSTGGSGYAYYTTVPAGPGAGLSFIQASGGAAETQPANISLLFCIVF